jgi:hypothetical protein
VTRIENGDCAGKALYARWPPRTVGNTTVDFFLWFYVKDKIYSTKAREVEDRSEISSQQSVQVCWLALGRN